VNAAGMPAFSARDQRVFGSSSCDVLHMELVLVIADNNSRILGRDTKLQNIHAFSGVRNLKDKICP
jgi:hypothetical protein